MEFDKALLSGSNALLVLSLLRDGDKYGYEMVQELKRRSNNVFAMKEGTLYPLLHALETAGEVQSYYRTAATGRERRYYHLTQRGEQRFRERAEEWRTFTEGVNTVLNAVPGLG